MNIRAIHPEPENAGQMGYSPGVEVTGASRVLYLSGSTGIPLYHAHPHIYEEQTLPDDAAEQARRAMTNIGRVLEAAGLTWRNVVRVHKFFTDPRDSDAVRDVLKEFFQDWRPASTAVTVSSLSTPGARVELEMTAVE